MPEITKEQIVAGIFKFFDDFEFIVKINDLTYSRKVQLSKRTNTSFKNTHSTNANTKDTSSL